MKSIRQAWRDWLWRRRNPYSVFRSEDDREAYENRFRETTREWNDIFEKNGLPHLKTPMDLLGAIFAQERERDKRRYKAWS